MLIIADQGNFKKTDVVELTAFLYKVTNLIDFCRTLYLSSQLWLKKLCIEM